MSAFSIRAEGGQCMADRSMIRHALSILIASGSRHELRGLPSRRQRIINGDDLDEATETAIELSDGTVYYSLNPVQEGSDRANKKTVLNRRWFLIDIDPVRPADVSATDLEKDSANEVMTAVLGHLADQGWPMPVLIDSGNGYHLLYRIDLPANDFVHQILKGCLQNLITKFNTVQATIDAAVHDAPRIAKLPGTWSRKGIPTEERPHRICRLIDPPKEISIVPIEKIQEISQTPSQNTQSPWNLTASNGVGLSGYIHAAIEREGYRILSATEGTRNNALNRASFSIGTMSGWPEMHAEEARAQLIRDGERAGLTSQEVLQTVNSGWIAGEKEPRQRPLDPQRNGKHENNGAVPDRLIIFGNEVSPKKIAWTWHLRIAPCFISIFAGKTGIGKSFVLCDITARLTTGRILPEETVAAPPCNVLFISEDPIEYVLVPRLMELKADLTRVAFMTWEAMDAYTLGDKETLEKAYIQSKCPKLIIFDPPGNFLGGKDEHKNAEVRSVVMKLVSWLDEHQVAAVFVTHINRRLEKGVEALDRIMGSVAWGTTARIALGFANDPDSPEQCVCAGIKNNLGLKAPTLGYEIKKTDTLATIEWKGEIDITADAAFGKIRKKSRGLNAVEWLIGIFRECREWESDELRRKAKEEGISKYALFESPEVLALPIIKRKRMNANGEQYWVWIAEQNWPPESSESSESC